MRERSRQVTGDKYEMKRMRANRAIMQLARNASWFARPDIPSLGSGFRRAAHTPANASTSLREGGLLRMTAEMAPAQSKKAPIREDRGWFG
jgi:hypothetical protein